MLFQKGLNYMTQGWDWPIRGVSLVTGPYIHLQWEIPALKSLQAWVFLSDHALQTVSTVSQAESSINSQQGYKCRFSLPVSLWAPAPPAEQSFQLDKFGTRFLGLSSPLSPLLAPSGKFKSWRVMKAGTHWSSVASWNSEAGHTVEVNHAFGLTWSKQIFSRYLHTSSLLCLCVSFLFLLVSNLL